LKEALEEAEELSAVNPEKAIKALNTILVNERSDEAAHRVKEEAIYRLARLYAQAKRFGDVMSLLKDSNTLFAVIPKAKTAKIVRTIIDIVAKVPDSVELQVELCREVVAWCNAQKRTFLRQRIESRLAALLFEQAKYNDSLNLINKLLRELKKFDDKQLLVRLAQVLHYMEHFITLSANFGC